MVKRILCCIDDSAHSRRAVEVAVEMAAGLRRGLSILLVNRIRPASGYPPIRTWTEEEAQDMLQVAARYAATHGVKDVKRVLLESADVPGGILETADAVEADHIVVGTGNPPFIGRLLLGSVSEAVVSKAQCSVTVAR